MWQQGDPNTGAGGVELMWIPCWFSKVRKAAIAHLPGKEEILSFFVFKEI